MKFYLLVLVVSFFAIAEESEFQEKLQEDMNGYKTQIDNSCGTNVAFHWKGGKLGSNPREGMVSNLCTSGLTSVMQACQENKITKAALSKIKKINCDKGKGNLSYKISGDTLTISLDKDAKITQNNNPAAQIDILKKKMITDFDN